MSKSTWDLEEPGNIAVLPDKNCVSNRIWERYRQSPGPDQETESLQIVHQSNSEYFCTNVKQHQVFSMSNLNVDLQSAVENDPTIFNKFFRQVLKYCFKNSANLSIIRYVDFVASNHVVKEPSFDEIEDQDSLDNLPSTLEIIDILTCEKTSEDDFRQRVLDAEVMAFEGADRDRISSLLRDYVMRNRNSNDPKDLVAVCSAIRKLVAYLPTQGLGALGDLLKADGRMSVPIDVELEVAKTVVRKLTASPPVEDNSEPDLADSMFELVKAYTNPRLLAREKYGATALNASLALLLLRSVHVPQIVALVKETSTNWYSQLIRRRIEMIQAEIQKGRPEVNRESAIRSLLDFSDRVCSA